MCQSPASFAEVSLDLKVLVHGTGSAIFFFPGTKHSSASIALTCMSELTAALSSNRTTRVMTFHPAHVASHKIENKTTTANFSNNVAIF